MEIKIIRDKISLAELQELAREGFGDMVKVVVDVEKEIMAVGGELHADGEQELLNQGSSQKNLWGVNLYPFESTDKQIRFESLINIRPGQNNRSMEIQDEELKKRVADVARSLLQ